MAKYDYNTMTIEDIIDYCKANGEVEWLKETAAKKVSCKVYPRKTIEVDGKKKSVADKDAKPHYEQRPISFFQIKTAFVEKFMPEIKPTKKDSKPTMYDIINSL